MESYSLRFQSQLYQQVFDDKVNCNGLKTIQLKQKLLFVLVNCKSAGVRNHQFDAMN